MPRVFPQVRGFDVKVNIIEDQDEPHVHAWKGGREYRVSLVTGKVMTSGGSGKTTRAQGREAERVVGANIDACWAEWKKMAQVKFKQSTDAELDAAELRGQREMRRDGARLVRYDRDHDELLIVLNSGNKVILQRAQIPGLEGATPEQLADVALSPLTTSITFPQLDADYAVQGLIRKLFGLNEQQRSAGAATSAVKQAASAENGKWGGRPRKTGVGRKQKATATT